MERRYVRPWRGCSGAALVVGALLVALAPLSGALAAPPPAPAAFEHYVLLPAESQVIYRVGEVFFEEGTRFHLAVGTTNAVQGEVLIDRVHPRRSQVGPITVDISQFKSDSSRRDSAIRRRWLESQRFPTAVFTPTAIQGLPDVYTPGRPTAVQIVGDLKIREVTRPTTFAGTLRLDGDTLTGEAATTIRMTDFGFDPPSILGILKTENDAKLEFHFVARRIP